MKLPSDDYKRGKVRSTQEVAEINRNRWPTSIILGGRLGAESPPINFKLDVVEVSTNANDEPVTSCVVSYGKKPERSSKKTPAGSAELSDINRLAVNALMLASVKSKKQVDGKYGADSKTWRSTFYDLRKENDDIAQETLKKSFLRAKENLRELGLIEEGGGVFFLTDPARQEDIKKKSAKK